MVASVVDPITNTTTYPVYATKAALCADLVDQVNQPNRERLKHIIYRLSNTTTSGWADPAVRHDA